MAEEDLPAEVRALIRDHLETYERLEVLLLLHQHRDQSCSSEWVAEQLRLGESLVAEALVALEASGFLRRVPGPPAGLRLAPVKPELAAAVDQLAATYATHRLELVRFMSACAIERMRTAALRTFADSFVFGRKKPDEKKDDE